MSTPDIRLRTLLFRRTRRNHDRPTAVIELAPVVPTNFVRGWLRDS